MQVVNLLLIALFLDNTEMPTTTANASEEHDVSND